MGIVQRQSFYNTIITYIGFAIGAVNVLFLYTKFLPNDYHGLLAFVLSTSYIMMPIFALGVQNTIIKFYSSFKTRNNINSFLTLMLFLPFAIIIPTAIIGSWFYEEIASLLAHKNEIIQNHVWLIFVVAVSLAYFEIFYAWAKVQMQSVFGNFMKEIFHRIGISILILLLYKDIIITDQFIYGVVVIYVLRMMLMKLYAYYLKRPVFRFGKIPKLNNILKYSLLIIIAGSVGSIVLEIDKFMIGEYLVIDNVAFYGVAIYIASVIGVPARSMHQITNPITAKLLNENNKVELKNLYKKSSLNLFIISGLMFLLIILNINELYKLIPEEFGGAVFIVLLVGIAKLTDNLLGNNNAILFNSDYYRMVLALGAFLAVITVILNMLLIPCYGINGAAIATFASILLYNIAKISYVHLKFKMTPFSIQTLSSAVLILVLTLACYFWDFGFHPIINIALKSILVALIYVVVVYKLKFSEDINQLLDNLKKKIL